MVRRSDRHFGAYGCQVIRAHCCASKSAPDVDAAVAWFDQNQVTFVKRPDQGKMKDVAFIKDPDGYWIEIIEPARLKALGR